MAEKKNGGKTLTLARVVEQVKGGAYRVRRSDLTALSAVIDTVDNSKIKRAIVSKLDTFAEALYDLEKSVPDDARENYEKTIEIGDEILDAIIPHIESPPQGVQFIGPEFRKLFGQLFALAGDE